MFGVPPLGGIVVETEAPKGGTPSSMTELTDFYNDGSNWICKRCESELGAYEDIIEYPRPAHTALAKWMDNTRRVLICPRCGLTEAVDKS